LTITPRGHHASDPHPGHRRPQKTPLLTDISGQLPHTEVAERQEISVICGSAVNGAGPLRFPVFP